VLQVFLKDVTKPMPFIFSNKINTLIS